MATSHASGLCVNGSMEVTVSEHADQTDQFLRYDTLKYADFDVNHQFNVT